ncbi:MAG: cytidylate kinase-like family protein [Candidatus Zixiibacteriota bacterium]
MPSIDQIINRQFKQWEMEQMERRRVSEPQVVQPPTIITVSREHGSRGAYFAQRLADSLGIQRMHREVIDAICKSSGYRKHIVESLDEKYRSSITMIAESILTGQAMHHDDYTSNLFKVVLSMGRLGGVVLVGRCGNFILGPKIGFHIRVVCPVEQRVDNLMRYTNATETEARRAIATYDADRRELVRKLFNADINDPHHYDMIWNSGTVDIEDMVECAKVSFEAKRKKLLYFNVV